MLEPVLIYNDKNEMVPYSKIVVPSSMRSQLWKFFGFPANDKFEILTKKKIVCCLCRAYIAYNKNTTNLSTHLNCKHPEILTEGQPDSKKMFVLNNKIMRIKTSDETFPQSKRMKIESKFSNEIDTDWYIENDSESQMSSHENENIIHPTGITAKGFVHTKKDLIGLYIDAEPKSESKAKKSIRITENYSMAISSDEQDGDNQLIETLNYDNKEYADGSADELQQKDDFLTDDDFLTNINDGTERVEYVEKETQSIKNNKATGLAKVIEVPNIMDHVKKFLIKDLVDPNIVDGEGFRGLMQSLLPHIEIPQAKQVRESLKHDHDRLLNINTISKLDSILGQHKYSILINKIGGKWQANNNALIEISICFFNEIENRTDGLERRIVCLCKNSEYFFNKITNHIKNCCAILINFEIADDDDQSILKFSMEYDLPIIQSFSSILELAMANCSQVASIKEALITVERFESQNNQTHKDLSSCLAKLKYLADIIDGNEEIPSEIAHKIQIFINCLQPLKNCLDVLAFESTTYASVMKPIASELLSQHYVEKEASVEINETAHETLERDLKRIISDVLQEKIISNSFLSMASFLDPRFQRLTSANDLNSIRNKLEKLCHQTETSTVLKTESGPQKRKSETSIPRLSSLFANPLPATKVKMPKNRFDIEFRSYNEDVDLDMDQCPVAWWCESEILYPNLKRQVANYFSVPAFVSELHRLPFDQQIRLHEQYNSFNQNSNQTLLWLHLNDLNSMQ